MISLSTVIIGRNSEKTLAQCIESVLDAVQNYESEISSEIIYVDSRSSDDSTAIAESYKCTVIKIVDGFISAALGRELGKNKVKHDYIMFLDADMEVFPNWLNDALPLLKKHRAIIGERHELIYKNDILVDEILRFNNIKEVRPIRLPGGFLMIEKNLAEDAHYHALCKTEEEGDFYAQFHKISKIMAVPFMAYKHHNNKTIQDKFKHHLAPYSSISYLYSIWRSIKEGYFINGIFSVQRHLVTNIISGIVFWLGVIFLNPILLVIYLLLILVNGRYRYKGSIVASILFPYKFICALFYFNKKHSSTISDGEKNYIIKHN